MNILLLLILLLSYTNYTQATDNSVPQPSLRTGFYFNSFQDLSQEDIKIALRYWIEEIGKQAEISVSLYIYTSLNKMRTDFYQGKINLIVASPLIIVNEFDREQLSNGFKVAWSDVSEDNLLVVTNRQSNLKNFKSVKNKNLSLLKNEPISILYADVLALQYFGKTSKQIFNQIEYIKKSNRLIYQLFFNKTDVIFVYQVAYEVAIELNPQIEHKTQVISELPNIPRVLAFFHSRVDFKLRETILSVVEKLDTYIEGRQLLSLFKADKTVRCDTSDLFTTEQLQQRYQQLIKQTDN